jgi:hypothetical protein
VTVRAPAKLNLHLSVGRRRDDGFHDLTTVFQAVGLYDDVELVRASSPSIAVTGEDADLVPLDDSNLALRAVRLMAEHTGNDPSLEVHIRKGIPVAGGCAAARPTPRRRWWAATRCGERGCRRTSWRCWAPSSAATCRSRCTGARPWAPVAGSS